MARMTLRLTRMDGQFVDDEGRLWVRDDRMQPGSQQPRFHVFVCSGCAQPAVPVAYLRHRTAIRIDPAPATEVQLYGDTPEARCEDCVEIAVDNAGVA